MINYVIIFIALAIFLFASVKQNAILKTSGLFVSFCLVASLLYTDKSELFIVTTNGFFIFLLIFTAYKKYDGEA